MASTVTKIELCRRARSEADTRRTRGSSQPQRDCGFHTAAAISEVTEMAKEKERAREKGKGGKERPNEICQEARGYSAVAGDHLSWSAIAAMERSDSPFDMRTGL